MSTITKLQNANVFRLLMVVAGILITSFSVIHNGTEVLGDGIRRAPDGIFDYALRHSNHGVEVQVVLPTTDLLSRDRYREASNERAKQLLNENRETKQSFWTTITFSQPISLTEMENLLQDANVEIKSVTRGGVTASGERVATTFWIEPRSNNLEPVIQDEEMEVQGPASDISYFGYVVAEGYIRATPGSLGQLINDPRVYLVDTTGYEVMRLANLLENDQSKITVRLPTPFWTMEWK